MNKKLGKSEEIHYVKKQKVLAGSDAHLVWQHFTFGFPIAVMTSNRDCHHSRVKTSQIILVLEFQGSSAQVLDKNQDHEEFVAKCVKNGVPTSTDKHKSLKIHYMKSAKFCS